MMVHDDVEDGLWMPQALIGVSASRGGLTGPQREVAEEWLARLAGRVELHHGDCVGGDEELADMATELGMWTVAHPPVNDRLRAFHRSTWRRPPEQYMTRNRRIVAEVAKALDAGVPAAMWAFPSTATPVARGPGSGTWRTVGIARRMLPPQMLTVVLPDAAVLSQVFVERCKE